MDREQLALELAIIKLRSSNIQTDQPMRQLSRYYHEIKGYMNIQDTQKDSLKLKNVILLALTIDEC